jgi:hypothetical protein
MRRDDFAAAFAGMKNLRIDALSEIQEIQVAGDWHTAGTTSTSLPRRSRGANPCGAPATR